MIDWSQLGAMLSTDFLNVGAATLSIRLMVGLLYLQLLHNLPEEMVLEQ